ncbi:MAG TPA: type II CAAX endopeptidase family protein [Candidatus Saccharimonadales bacterium]|nr:type II CAAX endopeptidase family protein [Candidatus Saccharimonadales bacterium]
MQVSSEHNSLERPATEPRKPMIPWNSAYGVIFILIIFFGSQVLAGLLLSLYPLARHWSSSVASQWLTNSVFAQFLFILIAESIVLVSIYLWLRHYKVGFSTIGLKKPRWLDVGYGLIAVPVYYGLSLAALVAVKKVIPSFNTNETQQVGFSHVHGSLALTLTFISLAILPPITEEIMVRGFLYGSLKKALPILWSAVITSVLFAGAHLGEGTNGLLWTAGVSFFILSVVLIYLREKTGSLWASILVHGINNTVAFIGLYLVH